ncbi:hypothetical protein PI124_g18445 [Phytophthora idaei]|nr:hypothetical protein PI125_g25597 [Phytophthora idaei]KAG3136588.1 hypothetical protein PI126_g17754 [Phytophthora idaei]KAG3236552.1 hypothetical protein PI124_g18445 [Phytophthora idaei]
MTYGAPSSMQYGQGDPPLLSEEGGVALEQFQQLENAFAVES